MTPLEAEEGRVRYFLENAGVGENADHILECYKRAYAHELAEEIRALRITPSGHPSYDDGKDAGLDTAANHIDPEVQ